MKNTYLLKHKFKCGKWVLTLKLFISPIHWMRCLPSSIFLFLQCANLIVPSLQKKKKLLKHPKIEGLILKFRVSFLWPIYMWKEDKSEVLLGKWTVDSPLSTPHTTWKKKIPPPPLPPPPKNKREARSLHNETSHWLLGNSISKIGCHYFWPGLILLPKNTLTIRLDQIL